MEVSKKNNMQYRYLGNTGLRVSIISLGNSVNVWHHHSDQQEFMDALTQKCLDYGINHFDTACVYGMGRAETQLGSTL